MQVEKWWDSSIVTFEVVGQQSSYIMISIGTAVQWQLEKWWDSSIVTFG